LEMARLTSDLHNTPINVADDDLAIWNKNDWPLSLKLAAKK